MDFKIRDLRKKDQFKIDDTYLNGYAKHLGTSTSAIYMSLCRHAEFNSQKCFPSEKLLAEEHNITERTVRRAVKKLVSVNIVQVERRKTKEGKWSSNTYILLDKSEWMKPEDTSVLWMEKDKNDINQRTKTTQTRGHQRPTKDTNNKDTNKDIAEGEKTSPENSFSLEEKLSLMEKDAKRHIQVIALYWRFKKVEISNEQQYQALLKRDLRAARELQGFPDKRIEEVMEWLEYKNTFFWTLETVLKFVGENLKQIKPIK